MEFGKYYDATKMIKKEYTDVGFGWVYVGEDVLDFHVCRIIKGKNEEWEDVEGKFLVELYNINKYDLLEFISSKLNKNYKANNRAELRNMLQSFSNFDLVNYAMDYDIDQGFESCDSVECNSFEEAEETVDYCGYGIVRMG